MGRVTRRIYIILTTIIFNTLVGRVPISKLLLIETFSSKNLNKRTQQKYGEDFENSDRNIERQELGRLNQDEPRSEPKGERDHDYNDIGFIGEGKCPGRDQDFIAANAEDDWDWLAAYPWCKSDQFIQCYREHIDVLEKCQEL